MTLAQYRKKRNFSKTPEPSGQGASSGKKARALSFVIQKHDATRLHYDFRLELDGVLVSWAVPKGPSLDPTVKRLAVKVEDHPLEYGGFEGTIPEGNYGAGEVVLWDRGTWVPDGDPRAGLSKGRLKFRLEGEKLTGVWVLVRTAKPAQPGKESWLLFKHKDEAARPISDGDILVERPESVLHHESARPRVWHSNRPAAPRRQGKLARLRARTLAEAETPGAAKEKLPDRVEPELATLVATPPEGEGWVHEIKFDGYRLLARLERGRARLLTRRGNDWTDRFPSIARAVEALPVSDALLDGEVVVLDESGVSSFQALQNALTSDASDRLVYFAFDLLHLGEKSLVASALTDRKAVLAKLLEGAPPGIRPSAHHAGSGRAFFDEACRHGLEGIISKEAASPYRSGRTTSWLKIKCQKRQELVIAGFTEPRGTRQGIGALLLGFFEEGELVYAGKVGTGFTRESLRDLRERLRAIETDEPAFALRMKSVHWVKPVLVCEVRFASWTRDGRLRAPSFEGLREDKPAASVGREEPAMVETRDLNSGSKIRTNVQKESLESDAVAGVKLTHPDRVLWSDPGITKRELVAYYGAVADAMLPHVARRPLAIVRCPAGQGSPCFFQKHRKVALPEQIRSVALGRGDPDGIYVDDLAGLVALAQMNALEIHPWGSRIDALETPDRLVIDLDPAPDVAWAEVVDAARLVKRWLEKLGLESFVRTTGGKGLHLVVPIAPVNTWDELKDFAHALALELEKQEPKRFLAKATKAARAGKTFVDYLRNGRGATAIASFSTRAREGATVAVPLSWRELTAKLRPASFNVRTVPARLARLGKDPWAGFFELDQSLPRPPG